MMTIKLILCSHFLVGIKHIVDFIKLCEPGVNLGGKHRVNIATCESSCSLGCTYKLFNIGKCLITSHKIETFYSILCST